MHIHISGLDALITTLEVIVVLGALGLLAQKYHNSNPFWATVYELMYANGQATEGK